MKKKLKFFSLLSISLATISLPLLFTKYNEPKQTLWYKTNDFSSKLEIRQPFIKSSTNNENLIKNSNNDFELKLLLNPNFISLDSQKIHQFNLNFIKKILETNIKIKSYVVSDFLPMVWFYFNNEKEREIFVKQILDSKEIFKFILFENNNLSKLSIHSTYEDEDDEYDEDYSENLVDDFPGGDENKNKFYSELNKNFSIVNLDKNKINKNVYPGLKSNNIGILEVTSIKEPNFFDNRFQNYFSKGINVTDPFSNQLRNQYKSHSTFVSMIAGGKYGADNDAKIFLSHFNTDAEWTKSIEDMVKNNVRIINHSYGVGEVTNLINYNDNSLFLDYISRKFGVINVFSSGNGENDDTLNSYITDSKLSFNSIVVGALKNFSTPESRSKNLIAPYSNYRLTDELKDISKPLVVAPGHYWNPTIIYNNHNSYGWFDYGTSYASPLVAGLISDLLKIKPEINKNDEFRIPMVKSIISASSLTPQLDDLKFKTSGFEKKYGSGIIDFDAMTQASNNVSIVTVPYNDDRNIIFTSNDIYLKPKQTIKISSSWLYNAGILKKSENKPEYNNNVNWWYALFVIPGIIMNILEKQRVENETKIWVETHKNEDPKRLTLEESKKRQNNKIFSDYDLVLEKFDGNSWKEIKRIYTTNTNDELIEYKTLLGGWFRFKVIKASSALFENSLDDKLAVTYLVKNEN